jgi:hypothetical protein
MTALSIDPAYFAAFCILAIAGFVAVYRGES